MTQDVALHILASLQGLAQAVSRITTKSQAAQAYVQLCCGAGAIIFVYKLLVMNDFTGLREGLHGGSELVQLNRMVSVSPASAR